MIRCVQLCVGVPITQLKYSSSIEEEPVPVDGKHRHVGFAMLCSNLTVLEHNFEQWLC